MKEKILIVDDICLNREMLKEILKNEYSILEAENGQEAMDMVHKYDKEIAVILLDLVMPKIDGFQVLGKLREEGYLDYIAVLIISGENSPRIEEKCLRLGVSDFIGKPYNQSIVKRRVENIVKYNLYKNNLKEKVDEQTHMLWKQYELLQTQSKKLQQRNEEIISVLAAVVESRSLESGTHIRRVKEFTRILGKQFILEYPEYKLDEEMLGVIVSASVLHDIGKIAIPDNILLKKGELTELEYSIMQKHTIKGCEILDNIETTWDDQYKKISYEICRYHHERYDGTGYPDGLVGGDIPISAQLVAVADAYDALTNPRCYKGAIPASEAHDMILRGECGSFSPEMMDVFRKVKDSFAELLNTSTNLYSNILDFK